MAKKTGATTTKKLSTKKLSDAKFAEEGVAYVTSTFNNTMITIADLSGRKVYGGSAGLAGFKGTRKSTPYAASEAAARVAGEAYKKGVRRVNVLVKGPGAGRNIAIKSLKVGGLDVLSIKDVTPIPHNGCRPKNRRRM